MNGYEIKYNDFYKMWQVSHPIVGACFAQFKTRELAEEYCLKG